MPPRSPARGGAIARFAGLARHELGMALRRRGLWVAYGVLFAFHSVILFAPPPVGEWVPGETITSAVAWPAAGRFLLALNVFFPVVAGILCSDRVRRDRELRIDELQRSTALGTGTYVLAKYVGNLIACLLPLLAWTLSVTVFVVLIGHAAPAFLLAVPVAFTLVTVPAFAFVVAFALACPRVMPPAIFQILFVGYWFWANYLSPGIVPTLNGTLLTPSGIFAVRAFFGGPLRSGLGGTTPASPAEAAANLLVLAVCAGGVLLALHAVLRRAERRA